MTYQLHDSPADLVVDATEGLVGESRGALTLTRDPLFVSRAADADPSARVALVSGGGSGHEPLHTGFVGPGMLDAPSPARCSPARRPSRCWRPSRTWTGAPASC